MTAPQNISFPEPLRYRSDRVFMSIYRQSVQDYIRACEALLNTDELTDAAIQAIEVMVVRLSEKLLNNDEP